MKRVLSRLIFSSFLLASTSAFSAGVWKYNMPVNGVQSLGDGGFIIYGPPGADAVCAEGGKLFYVQATQGMTAPGVKSAMAVALLAFATGKNITFAYDNATSNCFVSTVLVSS